MKQTKFLFYLHILQDLVETMRPFSLKFQQNDLLSCQIPCIIASVSSSIEALSVTSGPSYNMSMLMTELHLHSECLYELLYKNIILEKPNGRRDANVDHNPKSYASFYEETCFQKITPGAELFLRNRYLSFKKTPFKEIVIIFDYKEWPKFFTESKKWGLEDIKNVAAYYYDHHFITEEEKVTVPWH